MSNTVKLSVNVPTDEVEVLKQLAQARNTTMTEVLRQAIATEQFLTEQMKNARLVVEENDGTRTQLVFRTGMQAKS
ncbi:MAG: ribbon-helix-helix domain-containing protein [Chloroflexota bacterium]|nr:ribbon-helix-helix domain-containing protein [Chloroflexota bacterium]